MIAQGQIVKSTSHKPTQTKKVETYYTARMHLKTMEGAAYDASAEVWLPSLAVHIFDASHISCHKSEVCDGPILKENLVLTRCTKL